MRSTEWFLVSSFLLIFLSLVIVSKINIYQARAVKDEEPFTPVELVQVTIEGAVHKPGIYQVLAGSALEQVLKKARPKMHADLRGINLKQSIENSVAFQIEEFKEISVVVQGALESSVELVLPVGSRICDLKSKISCTSAADLSFFKRRRQLRNGEIIEVPKKSIE